MQALHQFATQALQQRFEHLTHLRHRHTRVAASDQRTEYALCGAVVRRIKKRGKAWDVVSVGQHQINRNIDMQRLLDIL